MERLVDSPVNVRMLEQADRCWRELTEEALRRGFYGRASVELTVSDGTIQTVAREFKRVEK
ncbi:MAG TPA: hypothetical protein VMY37_20360 [Thermoguttaceae bacterium]|nr:hypothetical protein [Thermoguttaceae bacterium]